MYHLRTGEIPSDVMHHGEDTIISLSRVKLSLQDRRDPQRCDASW
jgi:hypothetical protein